MENNFIFAFLFLFHFSPGGTYETYCSSGERLHTPRVGHDVCIPCHRGTFIEHDHHFSKDCTPCTEVENPDVEVLVSACNSTHDAVILCRSGFYRRRARNIRQQDRCEKCTECPFPARPCEGYYNTVCCPPNHDAVMTSRGVFVCKERPIVCGAGQFFRTSSVECLPCPAGTFISDHSHTYKDCLTCEELSENNLTQAVITRPCSRTAPTLFGCKAGYFRDPTQESLQIEVPCTPCRICDRRLVDCGMFHDAVCDDQGRLISTAATKLPVSIGDEHEHEKSPPETSSNQLHETLDKNTPQSNQNDSECSSSTERLDTYYIWILQLIFVALLLLSILILTSIIFPIKQENLNADHMCNMLHHFHRFGHNIWWITFVSLILLFIDEIVVAVYNIKLTASSPIVVLFIVMGLSILIVTANVITFGTYLYIINKSGEYELNDLSGIHSENTTLMSGDSRRHISQYVCKGK